MRLQASAAWSHDGSDIGSQHIIACKYRIPVHVTKSTAKEFLKIKIWGELMTRGA